ncbi:MAG TPA: YdeI/OmpD-associated family protein [Ferruginibacter sp.]|nr:YdeI/OmpD-associated family protein [Ferruginibacter sp.]
MKVSFQTTLLKFGKMGEKTGWTYFIVPAADAQKMALGVKKSFRVKGKIDQLEIRQTSLLPMGDGNFIMPVNGAMRKALNKKNGDTVKVILHEDKEEIKIDPQLLECLADEPEAMRQFNAMPKSHQKYYSKWIESAKTEPTKIKRIAIAVSTLAQKKNFSEMLRSGQSSKS